jgi:hypothetical protein
MADRTFESQALAQDQRMRGIEMESRGLDTGIGAVSGAFQQLHQEAVSERRFQQELGLKQADYQLQKQAAESQMHERALNMQEQQRRIAVLDQITVSKQAKAQLDLQNEAVRGAKLQNDKMAAEIANTATPYERETDIVAKASHYLNSDQMVKAGIYRDESTGKIGPPPKDVLAAATAREAHREEQEKLSAAFGHDARNAIIMGYVIGDDGEWRKAKPEEREEGLKAVAATRAMNASNERAAGEVRMVWERKLKEANAIVASDTASPEQKKAAQTIVQQANAVLDSVSSIMAQKVGVPIEEITKPPETFEQKMARVKAELDKK